MPRCNVLKRVLSPLDETGEVRVLHRTATPDEEQRAIDEKRPQDSAGVRITGHFGVRRKPKNNRVRLFKVAMEMKYRAREITQKNLLHLIRTKPSNGLAAVGGFLEQGVVVQRCQHAR